MINRVVYSGLEYDCNGISKTIEQLKTKETYEVDLDWKFGDDDANPWNIDSTKNNGLPYLYCQE
jgi:hypothetical protein